jgi:hypothetical protein
MVGPDWRPPHPIEAQLDRIERKLDALLKALAEEEEPTEDDLRSLDGEQVSRARDNTKSLD